MSNEIEPRLLARSAAMTDRIEVDAAALRTVLVALAGPGHLIRELQATCGELFPDNPITKLVNEFNAWIDAQNQPAPQEATHD